MKEIDKQILNDLVTFCRVGDMGALERFELIKPIFEIEFHQYEFDCLRYEIGRCYVIDAYQACITLTNHLLERYCKMLLIYYDSGFKKIKDLKSVEKSFSEANSKYLDKDLSTTLQVCKRFGFITKEEWKSLEEYREQFRNGYSHANPEKILGDAKGGFMLGSFLNEKPNEHHELTFSKVPFIQGIAIENFSKANALQYFIEVENLMRRTINYIQADEDRKEYKLVRLAK